VFLDVDNYGYRGEPAPKKSGVTLTPSQQKLLMGAILLELLLTFLAPIGGASVVEAVLAAFR
jgi:hypothetical protein